MLFEIKYKYNVIVYNPVVITNGMPQTCKNL